MSLPEIIKVDLNHFPTDKRFVQIPGKLVLADNLGNENFSSKTHEHPDYPVQVNMAVCFICLSGKIEMEIDLKNYTLTNGHTATILPGAFLQIKHIEEGTKSIFYAISTDFIKFTGNVKMGIEYGTMLKDKPVHKPGHAELKDNLAIYNELKKKLNDETYSFKEEVAKSYIKIMMCNTFQHYAKENTQHTQQPVNRKEELFLLFLKAVKEHYIENRSITFYADKLCISPKYLSSVVHSVSGKYATEWINQCVILEAKTMLRTEGCSIKDVSNHLNFANQSFFAKYFKQHTGYTPKEFKHL